MSSHAGSRSSVRLTARTYTAYVTTCPACGRVAVFVDGKKRRTVDTYSRRTHHRVAISLFSARKGARRHVVLSVLGSHSKASKGNQVVLDALATKA